MRFFFAGQLERKKWDRDHLTHLRSIVSPEKDIQSDYNLSWLDQVPLAISGFRSQENYWPRLWFCGCQKYDL